MQQYRDNNPDSSLLRRSMHQGNTNQDGPQLPIGTKNQEQEDQRGIRRPVTEEISASKQSPTYLVSVFFMGNRIELDFNFKFLQFRPLLQQSCFSSTIDYYQYLISNDFMTDKSFGFRCSSINKLNHCNVIFCIWNR